MRIMMNERALIPGYVKLPPSTVGIGGPLVQEITSPQLQLAGTRLAASPDGRFELVRPGRPARTRWAALGLTADGWVPGGRRARLLAGPLLGAQAVRMTLSLAPASLMAPPC